MESFLDSLLREMEEEARLNKVPIISPAGAKLLIDTVITCSPKSVLEIGTAIGYSTILIGTNAPNAKITTIEIDAVRSDKAINYITKAGIKSRVNLVVADAELIIPKLNKKFDLVFIDAAKGQYLKYLMQVRDKLCSNAVIFADNVLFRGMVEDEVETPRRFKTIVKRLRSYLDYINNDSQFKTVLHRVGDGIAISIYQGANKL